METSLLVSRASKNPDFGLFEIPTQVRSPDWLFKKADTDTDYDTDTDTDTDIFTKTFYSDDL